MHQMFEITSQDVAKLSDNDLRFLVARLAEAEAKLLGRSPLVISAGGNQNAPDGGIDVLAQIGILPSRQFIPDGIIGFQVKAMDMPPSEIAKEMMPDGKLRPAIIELINLKGAYIIVSGQSDITEKRLV